jgi:LysW-gamma-L-lysine carboxypeptidase
MTDDEAVCFLRELLTIPSVSGHEAEAVAYLVATMKRLGLHAEIDEAGNAIGVAGDDPLFSVPRVVEHPAAIERPLLLFLGHIDTVAGHVPVRFEDGRLYGRGAVDAKGPLAAAVVAAGRARLTSAHLVIAGAVQEEGPSVGARYLRDRYQPQALIIGEPSGWDALVLGYKGSMRAELLFEQPVGHSAGPEASVCDVAVAAWQRVLTACEAAVEAPPHGRQSEKAPSPTTRIFNQLTPTLLSFESSSDGLVSRARLWASFRLPPQLSAEAVQAVIVAAAPEARITFGEADPAYRAPKDTWLVASFLRALRAESAHPRFKVKTGTSDMNVVAPVWRCPAVAYGPGDSTLDHTPYEHILIDDYLRAIRVLTHVFQELESRSSKQ